MTYPITKIINTIDGLYLYVYRDAIDCSDYIGPDLSNWDDHVVFTDNLNYIHIKGIIRIKGGLYIHPGTFLHIKGGLNTGRGVITYTKLNKICGGTLVVEG